MHEVSSKNMDHHGLVASIAKLLKLEDKINQRLPLQNRKENITRGQSVLAMIINGLGFAERRLYMVSHFFKDKPVDILLGKNVTADKLNDDNLGRTLDAIYDYGPTKFYSEIAFEIALEHNALSRSYHLDTTSISVEGDYNNSSPEDSNLIHITHGHSKDHRPDLKQFVLSLTTSGDASFPIWMEALSGNSSDKTSFINTIESVKKFQEGLKESEDKIWVADSCLYSKKRLLSKANEISWITRVPETIKDVKKIINKSKEEYSWIKLGNGYSMSPLHSNYGDVEQRWFLISSEKAYKKEIKSFASQINKKENSFKAIIKKLEKETFFCEKDALKAFEKFKKKNSFFDIECKLKEVYTGPSGKRGRPKQTDKTLQGYSLEVIYKGINKIELEKEKNSKGRFILATNELNKDSLPDECILTEYKEQSKTENSFRFLKDPSFFVSDVYLKSSSRIEALMVIMSLCLMIYNIGEYHLRKILNECEETVPNQAGKEIERPTLKWIFQLFRGIGVVEIRLGDLTKRIITNLTSLHKKILGLFGREALEIYGLMSDGASTHLLMSDRLRLK